jgi:hypothetical protein
VFLTLSLLFLILIEERRLRASVANPAGRAAARALAGRPVAGDRDGVPTRFGDLAAIAGFALPADAVTIARRAPVGALDDNRKLAASIFVGRGKP